MSAAIAQVWTFRSDSNPSKTYETLKYVDDSTSCNCPGWTRRVDSQGHRSCKHTRLVDQGIADSHCVSTNSYDAPARPQPVQTEKKTKLSKVAPRRVLWKD